MNEIRLIKLLKSFSRDELRLLGKFVESPFLKPSRDTTELFNFLIDFHPEFESPLLTKEEIFKRLFKDEAYNEKRLQNLIFDLTKSAEYFLAHRTLQEDETEFLLNLSKGYLNKNLPEESIRINKLIDAKLKPTFSPNKDYLSKLRRLNNLKYIYHAEGSDFEKIIKSMEGLFEAAALQFIFEYINFSSNLEIASKEHGIKVENKFIDNMITGFDFEKLLTIIEKDGYANIPYINLHYYRFKTIEDEDNVAYYYLLKELLLNNLSILDREEKWFFYVHLQNYCLKQYNKHADGFDKEILLIYRSMLENNSYSYSETEYLHIYIYRNIILLCVTQKDTDLLRLLAEKYTKCLPPENMDNLENFAKAHLYLIQNDFEKSLEYISKIKPEFTVFKTDIKNLQLKIYYEQGYYDQAYYAVDSFNHYIAESKEMPEHFKEPFRNFLKLYKELIKIKSGESKQDPAAIKRKIEVEAFSSFRPWLLEKAIELIKKSKVKVNQFLILNLLFFINGFTSAGISMLFGTTV
ncbi:MAG: hypothetical protein ABI840_07320 [bacterium]